MRSILFSSFLLVACGPGGPLDVNKVHKVNPETPSVNQATPSLPEDRDLVMLTYEFYADAQALGRPTDRKVESISFVDEFVDGGERYVIGRCNIWTYPDGAVAKKTIQLLSSFWQKASPICKASLVYHELGHCALDLDHAGDDDKAIMRPTIFCGEYAEDNWLDLVKALFQAN